MTLPKARSRIDDTSVLVGILIYVILAYYVTQRLLADWVRPSLNLYLVQPAIWLVLAVVSYRAWCRLRQADDRVFIRVGLMVGVVHVGWLVGAGLIGGMGSTRSGFDVMAYVQNTWFAGTALVGVEAARTYVFHALASRSRVVAWALTVMIFFIVATPYGQFELLARGQLWLEIGAGRVLPALAVATLATWFAARGGMWASLAYRAPMVAYLWWSLVLPDLHWSTQLAVGVVAPAFGWIIAEPLVTALRGRGQTGRR